MKTILASLLAPALLGLAFFASGRALDAAALTALGFAAGLAAWTLAQYSRSYRPLPLTRPIPFPVGSPVRRGRTPPGRLAA